MMLDKSKLLKYLSSLEINSSLELESVVSSYYSDNLEDIGAVIITRDDVVYYISTEHNEVYDRQAIKFQYDDSLNKVIIDDITIPFILTLKEEDRLNILSSGTELDSIYINNLDINMLALEYDLYADIDVYMTSKNI